MNRHFLGIDWLESQIQAINPILVLALIPFFTFVVYPAFDKFFPLTPLRKIGIGLFVMTGAYALSTWIQTRIDAGYSPSIGWQFLAYLLLTCSEVMVSIVGLEFAYTQAPRTMKSLVMSVFLLSIFGGNQLVSKINDWIAIPSAAARQLESAVALLPPDWKSFPRSVVLPGYDGVAGTDDDLVARLEHGKMKSLKLPGEQTFAEAARKIEEAARKNSNRLPAEENAPDLGNDPWGRPLHYKIIDSDTARIWSDGPDGKAKTLWDMGVTFHISRPSGKKKPTWADHIRPSIPWLDQRRAELGLPPRTHATGTEYETTYWSGGGSKLEGAAYYRFFTWLMLGTAIAFVPFSLLYKPKTYLQD
jgi:POT family proton-dependent oligopeptide transporter